MCILLFLVFVIGLIGLDVGVIRGGISCIFILEEIIFLEIFWEIFLLVMGFLLGKVWLFWFDLEFDVVDFFLLNFKLEIFILWFLLRFFELFVILRWIVVLVFCFLGVIIELCIVVVVLDIGLVVEFDGDLELDEWVKGVLELFGKCLKIFGWFCFL